MRHDGGHWYIWEDEGNLGEGWGAWGQVEVESWAGWQRSSVGLIGMDYWQASLGGSARILVKLWCHVPIDNGA